MSSRLISDKVTVDEEALTRMMGAECKTRNVTTDLQWTAAINGMTDAQLLAFARVFFKKFIKVGV